MKSNTIIFVIGFVIALIGGYFIFSSSGTPNTATESQESSQKESTSGDELQEKEEVSEEEVVPADAEPLSSNNCLSCHAVESLNATGGTTGPDLSNIYEEIEGKHGKDLDSFLQAPTSAVMSTVIGDNPLSDEERAAIIEALKKAGEK